MQLQGEQPSGGDGSIDPQKWLLDSIVGDKVEVRSLLPGDANPENSIRLWRR